MNAADLSAARAPSWRTSVAVGLYAIAFAWVLVAVVLFVTGLQRFAVLGRVVTVSSWVFLKWPTVVACAAWFVDSHRERRVAWLKAFVEARWRWIWPIALAAIAINMVAYKVFQHLAFGTNGLDLMLFESSLHNTLRGDFMWAYWLERCLFGDHFEPMLLALLPIYAVFPSPQTLMVVQGLVVAAACVPLFRVARVGGLSIGTSSLLVLLFFSSRYLWTAFHFDFHIELFTPLMVFSSFLAFMHRRWGLYYLALVGALCVKEDMGLTLVSLSMLMVFRRRADWPHALATAVLGVLWTAVAFKLVIPAFDVGTRGQSFFVARYSNLGTTHAEILLSLMNPLVVLKLLTGAPVRELVLRLGLLPLLDPALCVAMVPPLLIHLASGFVEQAELVAHYGIPGFSVAMVGLPLALQRAQKLHPRLGQIALMLAIGVFQAAAWPPPLNPRTTIGRELLAQVPEGARISAQNSLAAQVEPSKTLWEFPPKESVDWVLLDLSGDHYPLGREEYADRTMRLIEAKEFGVVQWREDFLFLQRGAPVDRNEAVLEEVRRRLGRSLLPRVLSGGP